MDVIHILEIRVNIESVNYRDNVTALFPPMQNLGLWLNPLVLTSNLQLHSPVLFFTSASLSVLAVAQNLD